MITKLPNYSLNVQNECESTNMKAKSKLIIFLNVHVQLIHVNVTKKNTNKINHIFLNENILRAVIYRWKVDSIASITS